MSLSSTTATTTAHLITIPIPMYARALQFGNNENVCVFGFVLISIFSQTGPLLPSTDPCCPVSIVSIHPHPLTMQGTFNVCSTSGISLHSITANSALMIFRSEKGRSPRKVASSGEKKLDQIFLCPKRRNPSRKSSFFLHFFRPPLYVLVHLKVL